jgi:diguanylate cyclase (GGDEF)-like protein
MNHLAASVAFDAPGALHESGIAPAAVQTILDRLDIAFQPIVDIHTGRVFGFEALTRGVNTMGFASPTEFFDRCAERGELGQVEEFLLEKAFDTFVRIEGHQGLKLFVNLDGRTVAAGTRIGEVLSSLRDRHRLTNANMAVEISERYDFSRAPQGLPMLLDLRERFGSLTLDDFGSGHANLQLFYHLEPAILKLDRFIISSIGSDPKKVVFLQHIVRMAHLLGSLVVAEGVETTDEYHVCRELGCDLVQGYAVARPTVVLQSLELTYGTIARLCAQDRRKVESDASLIMAQLDTVEPIRIDHNILEVFERFRDDRERNFFPVVDQIGFPVGLVHERDLKNIVYSMYGRDLLLNRRRSTASLSAFIRPCTVANINATTEKILEIFSSQPDCEAVLIVKESRYGGLLPANKLLRIINEKNLQLARDQNPLTRLPGNIHIQDYLANAVADSASACHFCYLDFDYFKPFNDKFGFRTGDRAILMCGNILRSAFARPGRFVGHVGGDDFFVGFKGCDEDTALAEVSEVIGKFKRDVESLYPIEDRQNGYIESQSRSGTPQRFPLLTMSGALLHKAAARALPGMDHLSAIIADAKKAAKDSESGIAALHL